MTSVHGLPPAAGPRGDPFESMSERALDTPVKGRRPMYPSGAPLQGWKEIANTLGVTVRTAQRWERDAGLPVKRLRNLERSQVLATASDIDAWRAGNAEPASPNLAARHAPAARAKAGGCLLRAPARLYPPASGADQRVVGEVSAVMEAIAAVISFSVSVTRRLASPAISICVRK